MTPFDLIVTIALGSTLAKVILNKSVVLADGVLAFFLLNALQYAMTYMEVRSKKNIQTSQSNTHLAAK